MNHTGITSGCTTCHNGTAFYGVTPVSKASNHISTSGDCVTCHSSFTSFTGGKMSHSGISVRLRHLPWRAKLPGRHPGREGQQPHPVHAGLLDVPQEHHGVLGHGNEPHRHQLGLRHLP